MDKSDVKVYWRIFRRFLVELVSCFTMNCYRMVDGVSKEIISQNLSQPEKPDGNLLVVVNPKSGSGKGLQTFYKHVAPELYLKNIRYELVITTCQGHAFSVARSRKDLHLFNGVVICSGDGMINEFINGLLVRPDAAEIIPNLPIGVIPSGSGNALLSSAFYERKLPIESPDFEETAYSIISDLNSIAVPVNLMHVETPTLQIGAFLCIGWGLLGKIYLDSEKFRDICGQRRLFWGTLLQTITHRSYHGRLSYLPYTNTEPAAQNLSSYKVYKSRKFTNLSGNILDDFQRQSNSSKNEEADKFWSQYHPKNCGPIPRIHEEVPKNWVTIEDDFQFVHAVSLPHLIHKSNYIPTAGLTDDKIYLTFVLKKDAPSKIMLAKFMDSIEHGGVYDFDFFKVVPVMSFRLEPLDQRCNIMVDGEPIESCKIQATVTNLDMAVMSK